jgi:hypothetical protein
MIGGISYFHEFAYDLLAENDRIIATTFDAAIYAYQHHHLKKIIVLSSSMVFESSTVFPTPESEVTACPPPLSTYGFQKLACEYYAKGAWEQYKLPYTIVRPFNCVGLGEKRALCDHDVMSGKQSGLVWSEENGVGALSWSCLRGQSVSAWPERVCVAWDPTRPGDQDPIWLAPSRPRLE